MSLLPVTLGSLERRTKSTTKRSSTTAWPMRNHFLKAPCPLSGRRTVDGEFGSACASGCGARVCVRRRVDDDKAARTPVVAFVLIGDRLPHGGHRRDPRYVSIAEPALVAGEKKAP